MEYAFAAVHFEAGTQGIQRVFLAGIQGARHHQRIHHINRQLLHARQAGTAEFGVEKAHVERGVVDNQLGTGNEIGNLLPDFGKLGLAFELV